MSTSNLNRIWISVPCPASRLYELKSLLQQLDHDPAQVVVICTPAEAIWKSDLAGYADHVLMAPDNQMTYGRWHNMALDLIDSLALNLTDYYRPYEVAILNSDCIGKPGDLVSLSNALRSGRFVAVSPDQHDTVPSGDRWASRFQDDPRTVYDRLSPHAFMVAGEMGLRFDEQFRWYFSDDDFEMQARMCGVIGIIGNGVGPMHPGSHELNATQAQHALEDRDRFIHKWGVEPW